MKRPNFDWDNYRATASYKEVVSNSPDLSSRRPPLLYNPEQTLLYLPSLDLDVATNDINEIKIMLDAVIKNIRDSERTRDHRKLAIGYVDCVELCSLLNLDPDVLLDSDATS